ncbi:MAG TPA: exodeoxyribonuclease VII large subunit [Gammaproteobacteria bacterium]|nr:exodeoxyribonuclease VII large subunit [Gammaproteobacteria bacterium]
MDPQARQILSISALNRQARGLLETGLGRVWVEGEISNLARPASGHLYFSLKDARAQVGCALFRNRAGGLAFRPENGSRVLVYAQVSLYEPRGNYQLIVERMEAAGDGALRQAFEALKARLQAEGLFDPARKQPLPERPHGIGVITSPSGAAIRDVLTVLARRAPGIPVIVYPVRVQGEGAAGDIVTALETAARRGDCDVLLLTRGGGSLEDLWPFNEEKVARAVAACPLPVVSAVGHEVDVVISDFAADARAPTPSAAAEMLSPDREEQLRQLARLHEQLRRRMSQQLEQTRQRCGWLAQRLQRLHPGRQLEQQMQHLDELALRLARAARRQLQQRRARVDTLSARLLARHPGHRLASLATRNRTLAQRLGYCINIQISRRQEQLAALVRALDAVSPLATLQRGYSITLAQADGRNIHSVGQVKPGDQVKTLLSDGYIISTVETCNKPS